MNKLIGLILMLAASSFGASTTANVSYRTNDYTFSPSNLLASNFLSFGAAIVYPTNGGRIAIGTSAAVGEANTMSSVGTSNATVKPVYYGKSGVDLQTYSIEQGSNVVLYMTDTSIVMNATGTGGGGGSDYVTNLNGTATNLSVYSELGYLPLWVFDTTSQDAFLRFTTDDGFSQVDQGGFESNHFWAVDGFWGDGYQLTNLGASAFIGPSGVTNSTSVANLDALGNVRANSLIASNIFVSGSVLLTNGPNVVVMTNEFISLTNSGGELNMTDTNIVVQMRQGLGGGGRTSGFVIKDWMGNTLLVASNNGVNPQVQFLGEPPAWITKMVTMPNLTLGPVLTLKQNGIYTISNIDEYTTFISIGTNVEITDAIHTPSVVATQWTGAGFVGNGSGLTNLDLTLATNHVTLATNQESIARTNADIAVTWGKKFYGDGSGLTNLPAGVTAQQATNASIGVVDSNRWVFQTGSANLTNWSGWNTNTVSDFYTNAALGAANNATSKLRTDLGWVFQTGSTALTNSEWNHQRGAANLTNWSGWNTNTVSDFYTNAALGASYNATNTTSIRRTNEDINLGWAFQFRGNGAGLTNVSAGTVTLQDTTNSAIGVVDSNKWVFQKGSGNLTNWSGWNTNDASGFWTNAALGAALNATNTTSIRRTNEDVNVGWAFQIRGNGFGVTNVPTTNLIGQLRSDLFVAGGASGKMPRLTGDANVWEWVDYLSSQSATNAAIGVVNSNKWVFQNGSANLTNWSGWNTNTVSDFYTNAALGASLNATNKLKTDLAWIEQTGSANLTNWSLLATNQFDWKYQLGSASLTNAEWNHQRGSANLTNWSALATNQFDWKYQTGDADLTNWALLATNQFDWKYQVGNANSTNWSGWTTNQVSDFYTNAGLGAAYNATNTTSIRRTNEDINLGWAFQFRGNGAGLTNLPAGVTTQEATNAAIGVVNSNKWVFQNGSLQLTNLSTNVFGLTPTAGQVIKYNAGGYWTNDADAGGSVGIFAQYGITGTTNGSDVTLRFSQSGIITGAVAAAGSGLIFTNVEAIYVTNLTIGTLNVSTMNVTNDIAAGFSGQFKGHAGGLTNTAGVTITNSIDNVTNNTKIARTDFANTWTGSNFLSTGYQTYSTNRTPLNTAAIDMSIPYQITNAAGTVRYTSLSAASDSAVQSVVIFVTSSAQQSIELAVPGMRAADGIYTNVINTTSNAVISITRYGNVLTNCVIKTFRGPI